ncbi:hypothetical protein F383_39309 [Gossypium arboreum]|nr:hypothetical protein F383_39309 [Gossypium arboreum]
MKLDSPN